MKRVLSYFLCIISLLCCLCAPAQVQAASISLSSTKITINSGYTKTLKVKSGSKNSSASNYKWSSSDTDTAVVDSNGKITAKKCGTAVITAKSKTNSQKAVCNVTVKANYTVNPDTKPFDSAFTKIEAYNSYTKQYYMLRSYLERINYAGGGTLVLTKGTYKIPCILYLCSNIKVVLSDGAVIKKTTKTGCENRPATQSLFQMVSPTENKVRKTEYNGAHNIKLIGEGNACIDMTDSRKDKISVAIVMGHNKDIEIKGIDFKNCAYGHFIEMDASKNVKVTSCTFSNNDEYFKKIKSGNSLTGGGCVNLDTPDKRTKGFTQYWTSYDCTPNKNVVFKNCDFKNVQYGIETHQYSQDKYHTDVEITNCSFRNVSRYAIQLMNWKTPKITNNTFRNIGVGECAPIDEKTCAVYGCGVTDPYIFNNRFKLCAKIACFKTQVSKNGYAPSYNNIDFKTYKEMAQSNYSYYNSFSSRELVVQKRLNGDGTLSSKHSYPQLRFVVKQ